MIPGPRARLVVLGAAVPVLVALLAGCGDDAPSSFAGITLPPGTLVLASAAPLPPSTAGPSTVPATAALPGSQSAARSTAPVTSAAPTSTTQPPAPCDQSIVETDIGPAEDGYLFVDLRCEGPWATMIAQTQQPNISTDEPVILRSEAGHWAVVAAGGVTSCESAEVPTELWNSLGCSRWQRAG